MMTHSKLFIAAAALHGVFAWSLHDAAAADKVEKIAVDASTPGTKVLRGQVRGYGTAEYTVQLRQGQALAVKLKSNSRSTYFNVTAPGAQEALFIGSVNGLEYQGKVKHDGEYTVNVYLMRNAARRNEKASYTLSVETGR